MQAANLIGGNYSGTSVTWTATPDENIPSSPIANLHFGVDAERPDEIWYAGTGVYGSHLNISTACASSYTECAPGASPSLAYWMDQKRDDGLPRSGNVLEIKNHSGRCLKTVGGVENYNLDSTEGCTILIFFSPRR